MFVVNFNLTNENIFVAKEEGNKSLYCDIMRRADIQQSAAVSSYLQFHFGTLGGNDHLLALMFLPLWQNLMSRLILRLRLTLRLTLRLGLGRGPIREAGFWVGLGGAPAPGPGEGLDVDLVGHVGLGDGVTKAEAAEQAVRQQRLPELQIHFCDLSI